MKRSKVGREEVFAEFDFHKESRQDSGFLSSGKNLATPRSRYFQALFPICSRLLHAEFFIKFRGI